MNKIKQLAFFITFTSILFCARFTRAYLEFSANPYNAMPINITEAKIDGVDLAVGDEIGIFEGALCVGAETITETITQNAMLSIKASANDLTESATNGFTDGNQITYRVWDESEGKEGIIAATLLQGDETFTALGSAYVSLSGSAGDLAIENNFKPNNFQLQSVYPNPFNPTTNITFELSENSNVALEIYSISGRLINSLLNEYKSAGLYSINWDAKSHPSGIYLLQLRTNKNIEVQKITYLK